MVFFIVVLSLACVAGQRMHFGKLIENTNLQRVWAETHASSDVAARRAAIEEYNRCVSILCVCVYVVCVHVVVFLLV